MNSRNRNIRCIDINPYEQLQTLAVSPENDNRVRHWVHQLSIHQPTPQRKLAPSANLACDKENLAPKVEATIPSKPDAFHTFSFNPQASEPLHSAKDHHQHILYQSRPSRKRKRYPSDDHDPRELRRSVRLQRKSSIATMAPRGKGKEAATHPASKNSESNNKHGKRDMGQVQERVDIRVGQLPSGRVTRASQDAGRGATVKFAHGKKDTDSDEMQPSEPSISGLTLSAIPEISAPFNPPNDEDYDRDKTSTDPSHRGTSWQPRSPVKKSRRSPTKASESSSTANSKLITKTTQLASMIPPIKFYPFSQVKGKLPQTTLSLWIDRLRDTVNATNVIPPEVKDRLDTVTNTPMKSNPSVPSDRYNSLLYDKTDIELVWLTISNIAGKAEQYRTRDAPESHWIVVVVQPLLQLVGKLKQFRTVDMHELLEVLDVTTVEISPSTLCPYSQDDVFRDADKRIDAVVGLNLTPRERDFLERGRFDTIPSINQTASFVNFTPIFANVEVKRRDKDPLIQLGAWIASEYEKRKIEGYSQDMPVVAITVVGDQWNMYLVYAGEIGHTRYNVNFVGPKDMGNTESIPGIFKILNCLRGIAAWGTSQYRAWVEEQILSKYGWT